MSLLDILQDHDKEVEISKKFRCLCDRRESMRLDKSGQVLNELGLLYKT